MDNEKEVKLTELQDGGLQDQNVEERREALKKLGKYAAYVAPFTVMALSAKAATSSGPRKH